MRQVPRYAIIGSGRLARHFSHYFSLLSIPFQQWSRSSDPSGANLPTIIAQAERVLLLISDAAIEAFIEENECLKDKILIHCSGQLHTPLAYSAHPPFPFAQELYSLACYQNIPFVIEQEGPEFSDLLPGLPNAHVKIAKELKPFYHALCVMGGNFTSLLWQKVFREFEGTLKIPKEIVYPYLNQVCFNLQREAESALTGPLVRGDEKTISANLQALTGDPFQKIYLSFVNLFKKLQENT